VTLEYAEARLHSEAARVQTELERRAHARPLFRDCAARYLAQRSDRRSQVTLQIHVRLLLPQIGDLQPQQVHDATLAMEFFQKVWTRSTGSTCSWWLGSATRSTSS
jgi:hypothetical protein